MSLLTAYRKTNGQSEISRYEVRSTTDYSIFRKLNDNRDENLLHIKRLERSFREQHLVSPIIVNEKMQVIDGQHRLSASINTGVPVYYIIIPGYGINEVTRLNTNQKNWNKMDYMSMYVADGRQAYIELQEFMLKFPDYGIRASESLLTLRNVTGGSKRMKAFEEGKLKVPNLTLSYVYARKILEFKDFFKEYNTPSFVLSLMPLLDKKKIYNHQEMLKKLKTCPIKLQRCATIEGYRLLLEEIYNYKRQKENKVSFRYL